MSEWLDWSDWMRFSGARASAAGALSGFFGGLVGNQGGIRSAALLGFDLKRETFVATATAIGLIVDCARMPVYVWVQHDALMTHWVTIAIATAGVVIGTFAGGRVLALIPEPRFRRVVAAVLGVLGIMMVSRGIPDVWP